MYDNYQLISRSIKVLREEKGYTQGRLAAEVELCTAYLRKEESGQRRIEMDAYLRILKVLGVTDNNVASIVVGKKDADFYDKYQYIMKNCTKSEKKFLINMLEELKINMREVLND